MATSSLLWKLLNRIQYPSVVTSKPVFIVRVQDVALSTDIMTRSPSVNSPSKCFIDVLSGESYATRVSTVVCGTGTEAFAPLRFSFLIFRLLLCSVKSSIHLAMIEHNIMYLWIELEDALVNRKSTDDSW